LGQHEVSTACSAYLTSVSCDLSNLHSTTRGSLHCAIHYVHTTGKKTQSYVYIPCHNNMNIGVGH
jgi:hypothetical protein